MDKLENTMDASFTFGHPDSWGVTLRTEEGMTVVVDYWEWDSKGDKKVVKSSITLVSTSIDFLVKYLPQMKEFIQ